MRDNVFFAYEAPGDQGGGAAPVDPAAGAPDPGAAPEPESWAPSREDFEGLVQFRDEAIPFLQQIASRLDQAPQPGPTPSAAEELAYDPFDEESVRTYIERSIEGRVTGLLDQHLGPLQPILDHVTERESTQLAEEFLTGLKEEVGEFDRDQAVLIGRGLMAQDVDAETALRTAAQQSRAFEERVRADERSKLQAQLGNLASAGQQPPAAGAAGEQVEEQKIDLTSGADKYRVAIERAIHRNRLVQTS